ncbi:hypothetical protein I601_2516 [Nocardioides dokdonensis FR1436]|uniref:Uncharacterized protein n=1 Tax=Nocardioides dokdonensis FR1436 TaxID=1300347 RepID=A0A1A9GMP0_9ACTN|nr:hypothetical protein [Nocardioides dokdonensis]ANH38932.1 hypothetical protein I601_2516 [Nocardioides dokdonensis FR1436]
MAKALIGYRSSDLFDPHLATDNARLRARVGELEALVLSLCSENDRLSAQVAEHGLREEMQDLSEMQPA